MKPDDITNCMRCNESLDRGYSSRWSGDTCKEVICFVCDKKETKQSYLDTRALSGRLIMDNMSELFYTLEARDRKSINTNDIQALNDLKTSIEIQTSSLKIQEKIKEFESKVWFSGLQDQILKSKAQGISAHPYSASGFCVLTFTMAGRTMITIENNKHSVTCIADETSKESRTGMQSVQGTFEECVALYDRAIAMYQSGELIFEEDKKVSMGF